MARIEALEIIPIIIQTLEELELLISNSISSESLEKIVHLEIEDSEVSLDFEDDLLDFFTRATSLSRLVIKSTNVAQFILSRRFCEESLPNLEILELNSVFDAMDLNGLVDQFYYIEMLPFLSSLIVVINEGDTIHQETNQESEKLEGEDEDEDELFDTIPLLSITAPLHHPAITSLVASFSHISLLSLTDNSSSPAPSAFQSILSSIHPSVRALALYSPSANLSSEAIDSIDSVISRFDRLDSLIIDGNLFTSKLFDNLPSSLVELVLTSIIVEDLEKLLKNAPAGLRHLQLDGEIEKKIGVEAMRKLVLMGEENLILVDGLFVERELGIENGLEGVKLCYKLLNEI